MNEIDNHIHEIVYQSFNDSKMYMYNGLVLGIYRILGVVTFLVGMTGALGQSDENKEKVDLDPMLAINYYSLFLPFGVILYDLTVQKMVNRYEYIFMFIIKALWTIFYWTILIVTYVMAAKEIKQYDILNPSVKRLLSHPQDKLDVVAATNPDGTPVEKIIRAEEKLEPLTL